MVLDLLAGQPQNDIWHDPVFLTILGSLATIFAGLIGAVVAYWVYRKQRSKKVISYQVISDAPIANINKGLENRVTIQLDGKPVEDARQVVVTIRNSGNAAVKRDDYDEPLKFTFNSSEIIGFDILNTEPVELINSIDKKTIVTLHEEITLVTKGGFESALLESEAQFEKFLFNPKQTVTVTFLLDRAYKELQVGGRIVDGEIVKESNKQSFASYSGFIGLFIVVIVLTVSFAIVGIITFSSLIPVLSFMTGVNLLLLIVLMIFLSRSK